MSESHRRDRRMWAVVIYVVVVVTITLALMLYQYAQYGHL